MFIFLIVAGHTNFKAFSTQDYELQSTTNFLCKITGKTLGTGILNLSLAFSALFNSLIIVNAIFYLYETLSSALFWFQNEIKKMK
jgi:hypothetical protein